MAEHSDVNGSETGTEFTEFEDDRNADEDNDDDEVNDISTLVVLYKFCKLL